MMKRTYNIGTECYGLIVPSNDPEFLLPIKLVILEKYAMGERNTYKVKIKDILEKDINYLKEHFMNVKVQTNLKSGVNALLKKPELDDVNTLSDLLQKLNNKTFYLEDNYITLDKDGIVDLYNRFVKYMINYHFRRLYQLTSRTFLINQPIYNNQKDVFKRRIERLGFGDVFQKYDLKLDI